MATGASHADVAILLVDARTGVKEQTRRHAAILAPDGRRPRRPGRQQDGPGGLVAGSASAASKPSSWRWPAASASATRWRSRSRRCSATTSRAARPPCPGIAAPRCSTTCSRCRRGMCSPAARLPLSRADGGARRAGLPRPRRHRHLRRDRGRRRGGRRRQRPARPRQAHRDHGRRPGAGQARPGRRPPARHRYRRLARRRAGDSRPRAGRGAQPGRAAGVALRRALRARARLPAAHGHRPRPRLVRSPSRPISISPRSAERPASTCAANDIAVARIDLGRSAAVDLFAQQRETGSFMLVDPVSGASVAGGVVTAASRAARRPSGSPAHSGSPARRSRAASVRTCPPTRRPSRSCAGAPTRSRS